MPNIRKELSVFFFKHKSRHIGAGGGGGSVSTVLKRVPHFALKVLTQHNRLYWALIRQDLEHLRDKTLKDGLDQHFPTCGGGGGGANAPFTGVTHQISCKSGIYITIYNNKKIKL